MTDWTRFEPEALEGRTAHAHTVEGTCVTGRLARVAGPIDQLVFVGVLQPVLLRLHPLLQLQRLLPLLQWLRQQLAPARQAWPCPLQPKFWPRPTSLPLLLPVPAKMAV